MSGVDGVWPWEGAGCQTARDAAPLGGEGCDLRMRVAQLVQRPGTAPGFGNTQDCTNERDKSCIWGSVSEGAP